MRSFWAAQAQQQHDDADDDNDSCWIGDIGVVAAKQEINRDGEREREREQRHTHTHTEREREREARSVHSIHSQHKGIHSINKTKQNKTARVSVIAGSVVNAEEQYGFGLCSIDQGIH